MTYVEYDLVKELTLTNGRIIAEDALRWECPIPIFKSGGTPPETILGEISSIRKSGKTLIGRSDNFLEASIPNLDIYADHVKAEQIDDYLLIHSGIIRAVFVPQSWELG